MHETSFAVTLSESDMDIIAAHLRQVYSNAIRTANYDIMEMLAEAVPDLNEHHAFPRHIEDKLVFISLDVGNRLMTYYRGAIPCNLSFVSQ